MVYYLYINSITRNTVSDESWSNVCIPWHGHSRKEKISLLAMNLVSWKNTSSSSSRHSMTSGVLAFVGMNALLIISNTWDSNHARQNLTTGCSMMATYMITSVSSIKQKFMGSKVAPFSWVGSPDWSNMSSFVELLVRQTTQKSTTKQVGRTPVVAGDRVKACKGLKGKETMGKWVTWVS